MGVIHQITHPHKLTESKVNYFANYYSFVINQMGKNSDFEIDNILSITEKIIFQIENNTPDLSVKYINNYLDSPLVQSEDKYFKEFKDHKTISNLFDNYRKCGNDKKREKWLKDNGLIVLPDLKKFKTELKKHMFKRALNAIVSFLRCSHEIEEHKIDLHHHTHIIAVELFYNYKGKADIKEVFDRIMSRDEKEFPFCPKFIKKNKDNLVQAKKDFIGNRTFEQQFHGIRNFLNQKPVKYNYVFRIGNIICDDDFKYIEDNVTFCSVLNSKIQSVKNNINSNSKNFKLDFFEDQFQLFAIVSQKTIRKDYTQEALEKASIGLQNINKVCNTSGFIDKHSHLFTKDFVNIGGSISFGGPARRLSKTNISSLASLSAFQYLSDKKIKSKAEFLKHEKTYLEAKSTGKMDDYWRYIENLMGKPLILKFIKIISKTLIQADIQIVELYVQECFSLFNSDSKSLGITIEDQTALFNDMVRNENFDYSSLIPKTNNEFVIDIINYLQKLKEKKNENYIRRIINEIYEQRNFIQHAGKDHEKSILKLNETTPWLFSAFRRSIIQGMINNPNKGFKDVIELLVSR